MKNLIEEINGHKFSYDYDDFRKGYNSGLNVAIETINQYTIITAPKQIKLSEIVERLQPLLDYPIYVAETILLNNKAVVTNVKYNNDLIYRNHIIDFEDNQIYYIHLPKEEKFKWLYALWIAETTIIDDLECDK